MAAVPSGYTAGSPVNGVIPLYDSTSGLIAGTMQGGQTNIIGKNATPAQTGALSVFPNEIGVSGAAATGAGAGAGAASPSYLSGSGGGSGGGGSGNMTWQDIMDTGYGASDIALFQQHGWSPAQVMDSIQKGYATPPAKAAATPQQDAFGNTTLSTDAQGNKYIKTSSGSILGQDPSGNYFTHDASGNNVPVSDTQAQAWGFRSANPESAALKQMQQIDPTTEALRTSLGQSYADSLSKASIAPTTPTAADYQSYLSTFQQVDPEEYAQRQGLATSMDSYLKSVQDQYALGSQLDPTTARQVEQQARMGQAARGNVYGTPQMVSEAMATGQAGEQRLQQRQAALGAALGSQQSYLGAGLGLGDTAMNLYQQDLANKQQALANKSNAQQSALSYLGSGQTPYQVGSNYVTGANANAASAAGGGPVYQPAALGAGQLGTAQQAPQYGLDVGAQAQSYYNSLNSFGGGGAATKNRTAGALTGAASGAISGATAGAPLAAGTYGLSIPIGAAIGGALGGASGYYS